MAKFIMLITRPWPFVLQSGASLLQLENVSLVKHTETRVGFFFTGLHKVGGMMWLQLPLSWEELWSTKWGYWTPYRAGLETELPQIEPLDKQINMILTESNVYILCQI